MTKLFKNKIKQVSIMALVLISTTSMLVGCTKTTEAEENTSEQVVEKSVVEEGISTESKEKLSQENRVLVDEMLKRMESAINKSDTAAFSSEFKLLMTDYNDEQLYDINTKLLAYVEDAHDFYFYELLDENVDSEGNMGIVVKMGYKNLEDTDETNEYIQMFVKLNEEGKMNVYKMFFLNEEQYAQYK